ncbi:hypothetical protein [Scopulibacillus daqui]|nr:hypothetical protein [Scopulibacillus daqui]
MDVKNLTIWLFAEKKKLFKREHSYDQVNHLQAVIWRLLSFIYS